MFELTAFERGNCPACQVSWQGEPIPAKHAEYYGDATHFSRVIRVEYGLDIPQQYWYDGTSEYRCPDCQARFNRWTGQQLKDGELVPRYGREEIE